MSTTENINPELTGQVNTEINLSPLEIEKIEDIKKIVQEYNQATSGLGDLTIRLENQKNYCMDLFIKLNSSREKFNQELLEKYGPFKENEHGKLEKIS